MNRAIQKEILAFSETLGQRIKNRVDLVFKYSIEFGRIEETLRRLHNTKKVNGKFDSKKFNKVLEIEGIINKLIRFIRSNFNHSKKIEESLKDCLKEAEENNKLRQVVFRLNNGFIIDKRYILESDNRRKYYKEKKSSYKNVKSNLNNLTKKINEDKSNFLLSLILEGKKRYIDVPNDFKLSVFDSSKPKEWNGKTIILIHGLGMSYQGWAEQIKFFMKKKFRVIAYDWRGHGDSKEKNFRSFFNYVCKVIKGVGCEGDADDLAQLIRLKVKPEEKLIILGHSYGGVIIQRFLLKYSNEFNIYRIILVSTYTGKYENTVYNLINKFPMAILFTLSDWDKDIVTSHTNIKRIRKLFFPKYLPYEVIDRFMHVIPPPNKFSIFLKIIEIGSQIIKGNGSVKRGLKNLNLQVPVLIVKGKTDNVVPPYKTSELKKIFPNSKLITVGDGHSLFFQYADEFNKKVESFVR